MKVAVVGATGLVGQVILQLLDQRDFPITELIPVASSKSVGKTVDFKGSAVTITDIDDAVSRKPDFAIFSAGSSISLEYAEKFAANKTIVIDNSSAWRMHDDIPLVVASVNDDHITDDDYIIANPNCSTMQLMMPLAPIHSKYGVKRMVIATYQSFTGTGSNAVAQYEDEINTRKYNSATAAYPHQIFANCIPHCGDFGDDGYTTEETKLVNETRKILADPSIQVTATAVRVPVFGGHSEAVNLELDKPATLEDITSMMNNADGVILQDDPATNQYPMPLNAYQRDEVFVGRIRKDVSIDNGFNMWIVSDNIRKGAATNTIQIAEYLVKQRNLG